MKKIIYTIVILLLSFSVVNAKCIVEKGTGKNIGDEIKCGTEDFYVISNDGTSIKMLAKYNLYVGATADKLIFDKIFDNSSDAWDYYYDNNNDENKTAISLLRNEDSEYYGVLELTRIITDEVKQDSKAIGAHGNLKVEPLFPEVAIYNVALDEELEFYEHYLANTMYSSDKESRIYEDNYIDFEMNSSSVESGTPITYLKDYATYLNKNNIVAKDVTILSVQDLSDIVKRVTNKELPLKEWANSTWGEVSNEYYGFSIVGSIKDQMPTGYEWLWSTTYYTRTISADSKYGRAYQYFVDTMGDLCNSNFCEVSIGAGIRPLVTISSAEIIYQIKTKTDGNGTLESSHTLAKNGEKIEFIPTPTKGYKIKSITVTDESGKKVIYNDNSFTMPESNVLIEAKFEIINPNTISISVIASLIFAIIAIVIVKINYKKMKWLNE